MFITRIPPYYEMLFRNLGILTQMMRCLFLKKCTSDEMSKISRKSSPMLFPRKSIETDPGLYKWPNPVVV